MYGPGSLSATRAAASEEATLMSGSITLGEVGEHTAVLIVACTRCERAGQYRQETLIERHGEDFGVPDLLRTLSKDCVKRASVRRRPTISASGRDGMRHATRRW
jgi:hypothetical protein